MDPNKLTEKAQEAIVAAQRLAESRHHTQLEPEHLLYALVTQADGVVPALLARLGIQSQEIVRQLEPGLQGLATAEGSTQAQVSQRFRRLLDAANNEAKQLKDDYISTEHYLLALTEDRGAAGQTLKSAGVTRDRVYTALQQVRGGQ